MSDQTPSPSGHFTLSSFGSVQVAELSTKQAVTLTPDQRADFDRTASYFRAHKQDHVLSLDFADEDAAKVFRAQARAFADSRADVSVSFPKWSADRYVVALTVADEATTKAILTKLATTYADKPTKLAAREADDGNYAVITLTDSTKARAEQVRRDVTSGYGATDGVSVAEVARIPGANYPHSWNTGANVTFRFGKPRAADQNGTVTTTTGPKIRAKRNK